MGFKLYIVIKIMEGRFMCPLLHISKIVASNLDNQNFHISMYTKMYQELRNFITFFPSFFQVWTILQRRTKSKVLMLLQMLEPWMKFFKMILNITNSTLVLHTNQNLVLYVPFYTTNPVTNIQTSRICTKHKKQ